MSDKEMDSFVSIGDIEYEPVRVFFDTSEPEPDVNWHGDFNINSVMYKDQELIGRISKDELVNLEERLTEELNASYEDGPEYEPPEPDEAQEWHDFDPDC